MNARSTFEDFKIQEKIGAGSYGIVYKVIRKVDGMTYAMKAIDLQGMSRKEQEECIRETRVLSSLDSNYIIKYYDSFLEQGKLYIITEYASNGNLHDFIKKQPDELDEDLIWKLFLQILLGLNHMHSKKILHRDIKTLNVFLDDGVNVKLGDMGVAKILSTNTNFAKTIVGTPYYLSPELCEDKPYNEKSDVWALGVILYECCTQRHPFDADNQGALILKILRGRFPPITKYSPEIEDLVKQCLTQNAARRPTTHQLLMQPSIQQKTAELEIALPEMEMEIPSQAEYDASHHEPETDYNAPTDTGGDEGEGVPDRAEEHDTVEEEEDYEHRNDSEAESCAFPTADLPHRAPGQSGDGEGEDWDDQPDRTRNIHAALMIQRAACLDIVGEAAFDELYALLRSNQVDEASMTDLSRLVFKIIPYEKSEVIQMMYKLLYLESQLEGA
eukprot:gene22983-30171_t